MENACYRCGSFTRNEDCERCKILRPKTLWWCESVGKSFIVYARSECGMRSARLAIHRFAWENSRYQKGHFVYVIRQLQAKIQ